MANELMERIYDSLYRTAILTELDPIERGNTLLLNCPNCGKREAYIYLDGTRIICNRKNNCGYEESLWDYISRRDHLSPQETLIFLAKAANIKLQRQESDAIGAAEGKSRHNSLEKAISAFQKALYTPEGETTLSYLYRRGWNDTQIKNAGFGFYPRIKVLKETLGADTQALESEEFSLFSPNSLGDTHTLVIPYRDGWGKAQGIIVRTILPLDQQGRKYLFNRGTRRGQWLFGMETVEKGDSLVVCEGYIDALMAKAHGISNAVATGGSRITSAQIENAMRRGKSRFILALDNAQEDKAGREGALSAITSLQSANSRVYIAEIPPGYKDPDEALRNTEGERAFIHNVEHPQSAAGWAARMLLRNYPLEEGQTPDPFLRDQILDSAMRYAAQLTDPVAPADFLGVIAQALRLPEDTLGLAYEGYAQRETQRKVKRKLQELSNGLTRQLSESDTPSALQYAREQLGEIERAERETKQLRPYTAMELLQDLKTTPDGLQTGYRSLDALVTIPQAAITLVAARPSHGKTTLLTNLFLQMIQHYPEGSFAFFSYEETRTALALNMINILAGHALHQRKNKYALQQYFRNGGDLKGQKVPSLDKALKTFSDYVDSGRLKLFEENLDAESLTQSILFEKQRNPSLAGVFIDYIQKIKWDGAATSSRQVELQRISGRILEAAKQSGLPIILAAQLGRPTKSRDAKEDTRRGIRLDNLRESGDIEQDANLVLGLFNEAMDRSEEENREISSKEQSLIVTILKNRNGIAGASVPLKFEPQILRVSDAPKNVL